MTGGPILWETDDTGPHVMGPGMGIGNGQIQLEDDSFPGKSWRKHGMEWLFE